MEERRRSMNWGKIVASKGGNMGKRIGTHNGTAGIVFYFLLAFAVLAVWSSDAVAYSQYSVNRDATNCRACHGDFRSSNYVSLKDGQSWGNIHDVHRNTMLGGDCDTCHSGSSRFPVLLGVSGGGTGLQAISCVGCHGRSQDAGHVGAGLRQHHTRAGLTICQGCHPDANPANYTPVGENVKPPYYANPGTNHPNMPTDPCNLTGGENFAASLLGLDNDGDNLYDTNDPNCASVTAGPLTVSPAGGLTSSGTAGGPFTPSSLSYTLTNTGTAPMNWTASKAQSWVTLSATGGTLAAGAGTTVTVSIGTGANSLAAGSYGDNVTFTNTTNGTGNTTRPVSLTVNAAEAPAISTVSLPAGAVNAAYNQTLAATGGTTPYAWSVSSGTLPAGLSLSAAGVLEGTPTAAGTSSFTVRVAGANGASSTKDFSLTINAAAPPPPIDFSSGSGGGGCTVAVRTGSGGSYIDGTLILAGLGLTVWGIRIRRRKP